MEERMYLASDFRYAARRALRGNWKKMVWTLLVFTILTGSFFGTTLYVLQYEDHYESVVAVDIGPYQYVEIVEKSENLPAAAAGIGSRGPLRVLIQTLFGVDLACAPYLSGTLLTLFLASLAISVLLFLLRPMLLQGEIAAMDSLYRRELYGVSTLFSRSAYFLKALWLWLVMAFFTFLWALLFFVPGIIAIYRYSMAPYLLCQNPELTPMQAIRESKRLMYGNKARLFCLHFSYVGWTILATGSSMLLAALVDLNPVYNALTWAFSMFASAILAAYMDAGEFAFFLSLQGTLETSPALQ